MRRRVKQTTTLDERLAEMARQLRDEAAALLPGSQREEVERKLRQAEIAANIVQWVSSPGLQPPVFFVESSAKK
jgi:hypothetical protein